MEFVATVNSEREAAELDLFDGRLEAVEIIQPPLETRAFQPLVCALTQGPRFMSDFGEGPIDRALDSLVARLFGRGAFPAERIALSRRLESIADAARTMAGGDRFLTSMRNWFAPGDLVWHVDRSFASRALRVLWPMGRVEGMHVTVSENIDSSVYAAFMRREHPILCKLDRIVADTGAPLEQVWRHRPAQVELLASGAYPYLKDPDRVRRIKPDAISIHRIDTPGVEGTYHRSGWNNRTAPGLQIIMTATTRNRP